jgi:hypothetical protein
MTLINYLWYNASMTDIAPLPTQGPENGYTEVLTKADMIAVAYDKLGIDQVFHDYAFAPNRDGGSTVEQALDQYGRAIAYMAYEDGEIDIDLVRGGFDRLYDDMEEIAREKYGPLPSHSLGDRFLQWAGVREPRYMQYFSPLDDRFWEKQFRQQFEEEVWVQRQPDESDEQFWGRYIGVTLHHFPWAYFSYI